MAKPGDVIDVPELGVRVEFLATAESTDGAYTEVDVVGRPQGLHHASRHVHVGVTEHHTVLEGSMKVKLHGKMHILGPGDEITIPPDTPHDQQPGEQGGGPDPHPPDPERPQRRVLRAPRRARLQPLRLPQAALGARSSCASSARPATPPARA